LDPNQPKNNHPAIDDRRKKVIVAHFFVLRIFYKNNVEQSNPENIQDMKYDHTGEYIQECFSAFVKCKNKSAKKYGDRDHITTLHHSRRKLPTGLEQDTVKSEIVYQNSWESAQIL